MSTATARPTWDTVEKGTELPARTFFFQRADLVRYAGASGDFNVIHWNERVARSVGLPNVVAHGMLTMGTVARVVTDWTGDPGSIVDYGVRFTRPVAVPDDEAGASVEVTASVTEKLDDGRVKVTIKAVHDGQTVLGKAIATVRLP
ncbi:MAG TPA: MaoC family dehydratase [Sporichthyaceae bacterium]|jgi:acyl dehydratase|nr:MaoC family dehydratase [Sporichthyaceae bacterium]